MYSTYLNGVCIVGTLHTKLRVPQKMVARQRSLRPACRALLPLPMQETSGACKANTLSRLLSLRFCCRTRVTKASNDSSGSVASEGECVILRCTSRLRHERIWQWLTHGLLGRYVSQQQRISGSTQKQMHQKRQCLGASLAVRICTGRCSHSLRAQSQVSSVERAQGAQTIHRGTGAQNAANDLRHAPRWLQMLVKHGFPPAPA